MHCDCSNPVRAAAIKRYFSRLISSEWNFSNRLGNTSLTFHHGRDLEHSLILKQEHFNVRLCPRGKNSGRNLSLHLINLFAYPQNTFHKFCLLQGTTLAYIPRRRGGPQKSSRAMLIRLLWIQSYVVTREIVKQMTLLHKYYVGQAKSGSFVCNNSTGDKYCHTLVCKNSSWFSVDWEKRSLDWVMDTVFSAEWDGHNDLRCAQEIDSINLLSGKHNHLFFKNS